MSDIRNILLVGVGGQGIILASDILARLALELSLDVKKSEVHGMAQRGGSVEGHVRLGPQVLSPLIPDGEVDFLLSMEMCEPLRHLGVLRPEAKVIISRQRVLPPGLSLGQGRYPEADEIIGQVARHAGEVRDLDLVSLAKEAGSPKAANVAGLGALSTWLPYPEDAWTAALKASLPEKLWEINERAFALGRSSNR